jgi:hypothetical protein
MGVSSSGDGLGGNITATADTIVSFNSVIAASSIGNRGGRVHINSQGIFADRKTQVIVTSGRGSEFNGQVIIDAGNNETLRGELKPNQIPVTPPIHNRCADVQDSGSSFTQIQNGGNPAARDLLGTTGWKPDSTAPPIASPVKPKYQEVQGWVSIPPPPGKTGRWVSFTTNSTNAHTSSQALNHANCK